MGLNQKDKWTLFYKLVCRQMINNAYVAAMMEVMKSIDVLHRHSEVNNVSSSRLSWTVKRFNKVIDKYIKSGKPEQEYLSYISKIFRGFRYKGFIEKSIELYINQSYWTTHEIAPIKENQFYRSYILVRELSEVPIDMSCKKLAAKNPITGEEINKLRVCLPYASKKAYKEIVEILAKRNVLNVYFNNFTVDYSSSDDIDIFPSTAIDFRITVWIYDEDSTLSGGIEINEAQIGELMNGNIVNFHLMNSRDFHSIEEHNRIAVNVINKIFGENIEVPMEHDISEDY